MDARSSQQHAAEEAAAVVTGSSRGCHLSLVFPAEAENPPRPAAGTLNRPCEWMKKKEYEWLGIISILHLHLNFTELFDIPTMEEESAVAHQVQLHA